MQRPMRGRPLAVLMVAGLSGCSGKEATLTPPPPPEVTVGTPIERVITDYDVFTGRVAAVEEVDIRARVRGYITGVHFAEGHEVKAGDVLVEIDERPYVATLDSAKADLKKAEALFNLAEAKLTRMEKAYETNAISEVQVIEQRAEKDRAQAQIAAAQAQVRQAELDLDFTRVVSPIDGKVSRRKVTKGNLVSGDGSSLLTTVVSIDPIYVYFDVDERSLLKYQRKTREKHGADAPVPTPDKAKVPIFLNLSSETGFPHEGLLDFADNVVDATTGTIQVRAVFENRLRLFTPGLFARVRMTSSDPYSALLVPERAIGTDQGNKYVLVVDANNVVEYRRVELGGRQDDGLIPVLSGVEPQDRIVINGLQRARPGAKVTPHAGEIQVLDSSPAAAPKPVSVNKDASGAGS